MKNLLTLILIINLFLFSCKKAGLGGKATIHVHVINGNINMPYVDVNVNFNETGYPGFFAVGDLVQAADNKGLAVFNNLKRGSYYFFVNAIIIDTLYPGGAQVDVENKKGEQHIVIDLAEDFPL